MSISKIGGASGASDNWELISSVTPTVSTSAVNFTGLGLYRKLSIRLAGIILATSSDMRIRLNNDSGSNYDNSFLVYNAVPTTQVNASFGTSWLFNGSNSTNHSGFIVIENCDTTGLKIINNGFKNDGWASQNYYGVYVASAVVSQVNIITSSTFNASGTVALYGVK